MRHWRRWLTGGVLALLIGAAAVRRDELAAAGQQIGSLSPMWAVALFALGLLRFIVQGAAASAVTPGLTVAQGVMVQQATTAANSTIVGGGPVATGLRIAMLRSWKVSDHHIGLSIVALNLVASYAVWTVALVTALVGTTGVADDVIDQRVFLALILIAVGILSASTALWWTLLRQPRWGAWIASRAQLLWNRARQRIRRLPETDLVSVVEEGRRNARHLARHRGARIVAIAVVDQMLAMVFPVAIVRALGITDDMLSTLEVLVAYGLIRLVSALTPIPGGLGVADVGMATLLVRFGGPESTVLAAVLLHRALTFLLPMITGGACFALWRLQHRRPYRQPIGTGRRRAAPVNS